MPKNRIAPHPARTPGRHAGMVADPRRTALPTLLALCAAEDHRHPRRDQPCRAVARDASEPGGAPAWRARCEVHDTGDETRFDTRADALAAPCDRGRRWTFLLHRRDDVDPPVLTGLAGLHARAAAHVRDHLDGYRDEFLVVYRYLGGVCVPVQVEWAPPAEDGSVAVAARVHYGGDGFAAPVRGAGAELVRAAVRDRVDHRADPCLYLAFTCRPDGRQG